MIDLEQAGAVTTLLINRPERRNALDHASVKALSAAIADAEADATCRCIVLRGAGGTFSSGRDLGDARHDAPLAEILAYDEDWTDVLHLLPVSPSRRWRSSRGMPSPAASRSPWAAISSLPSAAPSSGRSRCAAASRQRSTPRSCRTWRGRVSRSSICCRRTRFQPSISFRTGSSTTSPTARRSLQRIAGEVTARLAGARSRGGEAHQGCAPHGLDHAAIGGDRDGAPAQCAADGSGRITAARDRLKGRGDRSELLDGRRLGARERGAQSPCEVVHFREEHLLPGGRLRLDRSQPRS